MSKCNNRLLARVIAMNSALVAGGFGVTAIAQDENHAPSVMLEEVMVTARKKEESMQDVPVAVSAMNEMQMEEMKVRDLNDVWRGMPNVNFLQNGTIKGTANYAIRGVGAVSSIPGVEPVVGVFVDGVYLGQANGLITDMFDMQSIQVLRGPQGTLFGKNVTGGAVLMNTNMPEEEFAAKIRTAVDGNPNGDGGLNTYAMGMVNGSLIDSLSGRLVAYYQKDDGWFENKYNGPDDLAGGDDEFGESKVKMFRPSVRWQPTDDLDFVLSYEYQDVDGDGPAAQSSEFNTLAPFAINMWGGGKQNAKTYTLFGEAEYAITDTLRASAGLQKPMNIGDSRMWGAELEGVWSLTDSWLLTGSVGYLDNKYDDLGYDLNQDGVINGTDYNLDVIMFPEWTYRLGLSYSTELGDFGSLTARASYAYMDDYFEMEDNWYQVPSRDMVDAGIDWYSNDGHWTVGNTKTAW